MIIHVGPSHGSRSSQQVFKIAWNIITISITEKHELKRTDRGDKTDINGTVSGLFLRFLSSSLTLCLDSNGGG